MSSILAIVAGLAVTIAAGGVSGTEAQPGYQLEYAGEMVMPRAEHSATVLEDGRVLLVGGSAFRGFTQLASAEVYDPKTRRSRPTGFLHVPRKNHAAIRLPDGRVLIAGGFRASYVVATETAEVWDPRSEKFTLVGSLAEPHAQAAFIATPGFPAGLLIGGVREGVYGTASALIESFDVGDNRFRTLGRLLGARASHAMCSLPDGSVISAGGLYRCCEHPSNRNRQNSAERFDPRSRRSTPLPDLVTARTVVRRASSLPDGDCLFIGGEEALVRWSERHERWFEEGLYIPPSVRNEPWLPLPDGRVLILAREEATVLDPYHCTLSPLFDMPVATLASSVAVLPDGCVFVSGGIERDMPTRALWRVCPLP